MKSFSKLSIILLFSSCFLFASEGAFAAYPTSVVGTWNARANQTPGTMNITFQSGSGVCRQISGTYTSFGTFAVQGFYCPATGKIQFLLKDSANVTFQVYSANLTSTGATNYMGGSLGSFNNSFGEYSFFASK
jgi:hypothetical protein